MKPEFVDRGGTLVFELVCPFPAMLVLRVLPFGTDAFLEEVIVGLEGKLGDGSNVILDSRAHGSVR